MNSINVESGWDRVHVHVEDHTGGGKAIVIAQANYDRTGLFAQVKGRDQVEQLMRALAHAASEIFPDLKNALFAKGPEMTEEDDDDMDSRARAMHEEFLLRRDRSMSRQAIEDDWSGWHRGKPLPTSLIHATDDAAFTISPELGGAGMLFAVLRYGNKVLGRFFGPSAAAKALADGEFDSVIGTSARAFRVPHNPIDWKHWRA